MKDKKYIEFVMEDGNVKKFEILCSFKSRESGKNYVIFMDDENNNGQPLNVTAAIYKPGDNTVLEEITDEFDKQIVSRFLEEGVFDARY